MVTVNAIGPEGPGIQTLTEAPKRAFMFLNALGTQPSLRQTLSTHGYTQDDHMEGWRLLLTASGSHVDPNTRPRSPASAAVAELDAWDELGFHKAHAALARRFPEQGEFVFKDLTATQGPTAVIGIVKFLDRLDLLESGTRTSVPTTNDADKKAIEALSARGIGAEERARLRNLIAIVQGEMDAVAPGDTPEGIHMKDLAAVYAWYAEWAEVAHAVLPRRADLIKLGIARPRKRTAVAAPVTAPAVGGPITGAATPATPITAPPITASPVTAPPIAGTPTTTPVTNGASSATNGALATPAASVTTPIA